MLDIMSCIFFIYNFTCKAFLYRNTCHQSLLLILRLCYMINGEASKTNFPIFHVFGLTITMITGLQIVGQHFDSVCKIS